MLISIEGVDKAGKTTLCQRLRDAYEREGVRCHILHGPCRDVSTWEHIAELMQSFSAETASRSEKRNLHEFFGANREQTMSEVEERIEEGCIVLYDRYVISGIAYERLDEIDSAASHTAVRAPDLTLFLRVPPETAQLRAGFGSGFRETKKEHAKAAECFEETLTSIRTEERFRHLRHPIHELDASETPDTVLEEAKEAIDRVRLKEPMGAPATPDARVEDEEIDTQRQ